MNFREIYKKIIEGLRTVKGRNALTFFVFLVIASVFWVLMALNDEVQMYYKLPLRVTGIPEGTTILNGAPPTVSVTVRDKGSALMKFSWGRTPTLNLRFEDFTQPDKDKLTLSPAQLNAALRGIFGPGSAIQNVKPDSLSIFYTTEPGVPVKVRIDSDIRTSPEAVPFGRVTLSNDSVLLYATGGRATKVKELVTAPIVLSGLTDTAHVDVALQVPGGMRAVPATVHVTIPVEPLVSKRRSIPIEAQNLPAGMDVVTFPSMVTVTYLLPKSMYNKDSAPMKAIVNLLDLQDGEKTLPVEISQMPQYYRIVSVEPDMVEYVLEKE